MSNVVMIMPIVFAIIGFIENNDKYFACAYALWLFMVIREYINRV